jgi:hypothetical protein
MMKTSQTMFTPTVLRTIGGIVASILMMAALAIPTLAADAPEGSRLADDIALTKVTVSALVAKDFAAVRNRLDPAMGEISDDQLRQMADLIGTSEPTSIETIWSTERHSLDTGNGSSRILLEYALAGKWLVVDAAVKTEAGTGRFYRLFFTSNTLPLSELNAFHLFGKGPVQYLFLACWLATIGLTGWAMIVASRRQTGWRKWALIVLMPLGLTPTVAVNWNTAQIWVLEAIGNSTSQSIPIFAIRYPMALVGHTETLVPYLCISAPLIALGYLIWQRRSPQNHAADGDPESAAAK